MEAGENRVELPRRGTERHDALFNLGLAKTVTFERKDFEYCKNHMLMAFADGIPDFLAKMQDFMFYSSSGNGRLLVEAPAGRISPTNFTADNLITYNFINLSLLTICLVWEVEILRVVLRKFTLAPDTPILSKGFMIAFSGFQTATKSRLIRRLNPITPMMTTSLFQINQLPMLNPNKPIEKHNQLILFSKESVTVETSTSNKELISFSGI